MARYGSAAIRGHGIPEVMEKVLYGESRIPPRLLVLKPLSAAVAIGTGGPFGAEGPIIATGGSLGSLVGQLARVTADERKTLLAAGAAAGMAATFGAPVSAALAGDAAGRHQGYPVVDAAGVLVGVVTRRDLLGTSTADARGPDVPVRALVRRAPLTVFDDATLRDAADLMVLHDVGRLAVVTRARPRAVAGVLTRGDLLAVHAPRLRAARERQRGVRAW